MARTALTVTTSTAGGTVLPAAAAVDAPNGNKFTNNGHARLRVINGAGAPITVTIITNGTYSAGGVAYAIADLTPSVTNGTEKTFGPFDQTLFNDANGDVLVDWSSGTTITAQVVSE